MKQVAKSPHFLSFFARLCSLLRDFWTILDEKKGPQTDSFLSKPFVCNTCSALGSGKQLINSPVNFLSFTIVVTMLSCRIIGAAAVSSPPAGRISTTLGLASSLRASQFPPVLHQVFHHVFLEAAFQLEIVSEAAKLIELVRVSPNGSRNPSPVEAAS
jgi:hypothetical protein